MTNTRGYTIDGDTFIFRGIRHLIEGRSTTNYGSLMLDVRVIGRRGRPLKQSRAVAIHPDGTASVSAVIAI